MCFTKSVTTRSSGFDAEKVAEQYLKKRGYKLISSNFHSRFGEIDIIMLDKKQLVFVEVKARSSTTFGTPAEFITYSKLSKLQKTAQFFLVQNPKYKDFRFDAVEIYLETPVRINHIENITL